jgi:hypothetical protein
MVRISLVIDCDSEGETLEEIVKPAVAEILWALKNSYSCEESYTSPRGYSFSIEILEEDLEEVDNG